MVICYLNRFLVIWRLRTIVPVFWADLKQFSIPKFHKCNERQKLPEHVSGPLWAKLLLCLTKLVLSSLIKGISKMRPGVFEKLREQSSQVPSELQIYMKRLDLKANNFSYLFNKVATPNFCY